MRLLLALVAALVACADTNTVTCGDGVTCPAGTQCVISIEPAATFCVDDQQLAACSDLAEHHRCSTPDIPLGRCYGGGCVAATCGNGVIDPPDTLDATDIGEVCDEGDQAPGDGCSSDCLSLETCGNGITDLVKSERCDDGNRVSHDGCTSGCGVESARWSPLGPGTPPGRVDAAMAYDATNRQVVMYGGGDYNGNAYGDTWLWDGVGWTEAFPAQSPGIRIAAKMAYDSDRHRVVLFGGVSEDGSTFADTWEWDGARWAPVPTLNAPTGRKFHVMTYDSKRKVVVLFGGQVQQPDQFVPDLADTWLFDGKAWTQQLTTLHPGGPAPVDPADGRVAAAMAFDPVRGTAVLFGGASVGNFSTFYDDIVWELDSTGWHTRSLTTPRPPIRRDATVSFDLATQSMLLFGGGDSTDLGDQWKLSAGGWTQVSPALLPDPRRAHAAATDTVRRKVVVFGSQFSTDTVTWEWNGTTWSALTPVAPPLEQWISAFDAARGVTVLVDSGGNTWQLHGTSFTPGPTRPGTFQPGMAYDPTRKRTILVDTAANVGVTYLFNGTTWTTPSTATPALFLPSLAADRNGNVVLFGGLAPGASAASDETWVWNGSTWTKAAPAHRPPGRVYPAFAYDPIRKVTVMFGGTDLLTNTRDTWLWDGDDWTQDLTTGPNARAGASFAWQPARGKLLLFGGTTQGVKLGDAYEFDGTLWTPVPIAQGPRPRVFAVLQPDPSSGGMLLFAGIGTASNPVGDMWRLRWDSDEAADSCADAQDLDGDGLAGCADPDCYYLCAPLCTPGPDLTTCAAAAPSCGDGTCDAFVEQCRVCPADCGACSARCGDSFCDAPESASSCPGDCP